MKILLCGGFIRIDLHVHTVFSDGMETPEKMIARAKALHLDGIAITDHDSIAGWERAIEAGKQLGVIVIPGKEIRMRHGPRVVGEILALFLEDDVKKNQITALGDIVDEIRSHGGIAVVPHPFDPLRPSIILETAKREGVSFDAIESINGRNNAMSNAKAITFAQHYKIPQIGGSDAHLAREVAEAYTFCDTESNHSEEFRKLILKGRSRPIGIQKHPVRIFYDRIRTRIGRHLPKSFGIKKL